ncbi:MAG: hypothetical protein M1819_007469 [Sarea resinae]|nr:MAG: hypothetical protein M1819_007469 [Sarea resinae]
MYDFDATRPLQEPTYAAAPPPFVTHFPGPQPRAPHVSGPEQLSLMTTSPYVPRSSFVEESEPFIDLRTSQLPEVISIHPTTGPQGTKVRVLVESVYDLSSQPPLFFLVMFGSRRCNSALTRVDHQSLYSYVVAAEAPPLNTTGWVETTVPMYLKMEDERGEDLGSTEIGNYSYTDGLSQPIYNSTLDASRKRKISLESAESIKTPAKRPSNQQLQARPSEGYNSYTFSQSGATPYSPNLQSVAKGTYTSSSGYNRPSIDPSYQPQQFSPRQLSYQYPPVSSMVPSVPARSPASSPAWSSYSALSQAGRSPGRVASTAMARGPASAPSPRSVNPPLIRTSTLQHSPSPATTPAGIAQTSQAFNPYAMYPHKAILKIEGDLDTMAENWSRDEWDAKRRLVQFSRQQNGSTIQTSFTPISPEDRPPNSICISCIWWEDKQGCYVTSVDTIYLLESLVAVRFTVEEKNRIRRNLEGFRPLTVSKARSDSEDFFKVIMGFPNPKPRNIEKDVKVFPWKILAHALKKIIGKYVSITVRQIHLNTNEAPVRKLLIHRRGLAHPNKLYWVCQWRTIRLRQRPPCDSLPMLHYDIHLPGGLCHHYGLNESIPESEIVSRASSNSSLTRSSPVGGPSTNIFQSLGTTPTIFTLTTTPKSA